MNLTCTQETFVALTLGELINPYYKRDLIAAAQKVLKIKKIIKNYFFFY